MTTTPEITPTTAEVTSTPAAEASASRVPTSEQDATKFTFFADVADIVLAILKPISVPLLRIAIGVVYIWFGILKLIGLSPIDGLVASMVPFLPADVAVVGLGAVEVVLGGLLIAGIAVPWIAAAQVLHLLSTFAVFVFQPAVVHTGNPFAVTLEGEFIAKNLVLIAALFVVASHTKQRSPS